MTCVAAIKHDGKVWMAADSAGCTSWSIRTRADEKVFKNSPCIMGFTSSFRMGQLLRYSLKVPTQEKKDDYAFMVTKFVDAVRNVLKEGGYAEKNNNVEKGGIFLVGYKGEIYSIESDFQVAKQALPYASCGCGENYALGSLHSTSKTKHSPKQRLKMALEAAEEFSNGVRGPFVYMSGAAK